VFERVARSLRAYAEKDGRGYPDWALRYVPIVSRLERCGAVSGTILEIGANANGIARFFNQRPARIIAVDVSFDSLCEARATQDILPVMADASALPFRDKDIDVCVCVDTYEHLLPEERHNACTEILRVLADSGCGVVAFPSGSQAADAERRVRDAYRACTGGTIRWLEEHARTGLPDADTVVREVAEAARGARRVTHTKNTTIAIWVWAWRVMMCGWPGRGNAFFQALLRFLTPFFCRVHLGECYRAVIWVEPQ